MKKNMGNMDRAIRAILVVAILGLFLLKIISGTVALVLGIVAGIILLTSLVSFCPLYALFGISTCRVKKTY